MADRLPRLFIGSSTEGRSVAEAVRESLTNDADVILWSDAFDLGSSFIESLRKQTYGADFAVLIMTPDDIVESRGKESFSPRDNLVFELGLFSGRIGLERCYCIHPEKDAPKIPTDLLGVTTGSYRADHPQGLVSAVGAVCNKIRRKIAELGVYVQVNPTIEFCSRIAGFWWEYITPVRFSALGLLEITFDHNAWGIHIQGLAHAPDGSRVADWWTEGCGINCADRKLSYVWKGRYLNRPEGSFEGFGDFSFNESNGSFVRGHGIFLEVNATDLPHARKKAGELTRCSAADIEIMRSGDKAQISTLIQEKLHLTNIAKSLKTPPRSFP